MQACGKYILLKPFKRPLKKPDGTKYTADELEEIGEYFPGRGVVWSVGENVPASVKKGDIVRFKVHNEEVLDHPVFELWVIPFDSVMLVVEDALQASVKKSKKK